MRMNRFAISIAVVACSTMSAFAQPSESSKAQVRSFLEQGALAKKVENGTIITPVSSQRVANPDGKLNFTNTKVFVPDIAFGDSNSPRTGDQPSVGPPFAGYYYANTPASLACIYKLVTPTSGCHPYVVTANSIRGSGPIAIVDAYNGAQVRTDLENYSTQFGLPVPTILNFQIYYCTAASPGPQTCAKNNPATAYNSGWEGEISLDVQMVHAIAPGAKIYLFLAASNSGADLYGAAQKAAALMTSLGGGQVTMSFGHNEVAGDVGSSDSYWTTGNAIFFASTGDNIAIGYPATSTKVVSVGGTSISRNPPVGNSDDGYFFGESSWVDAGAGPSKYIARPSYQPMSVGPFRGNPDVSALANPETPVWVLVNGSWFLYGGTSAASPIVAALVNSSGSLAANNTAQENLMYGAATNIAQWYDVKMGTCGPAVGYWAGKGYDFCTGIGAPRGKTGGR